MVVLWGFYAAFQIWPVTSSADRALSVGSLNSLFACTILAMRPLRKQRYSETYRAMASAVARAFVRAFSRPADAVTVSGASSSLSLLASDGTSSAISFSSDP